MRPILPGTVGLLVVNWSGGLRGPSGRSAEGQRSSDAAASPVGAHTDAVGEITIVAPGGLEDLFELRVRPNLATPTAEGVYRDRMASKGWKERWPQLTIEALPSNPAG